ncbi:alpha/beta fold hydrolase [Falsiroseomonas sp. E2-1-a20]|uniref:alpha/beta fold hydrolase n=1 Tax=Falsiroseomonas sp. E2-1-a20 TaxID=3239300 RepID=UPI003F3038D8
MIRTRDGVGLFHRSLGAGSPVVFLASWSLPGDSWFGQMMAMRDAGRRAVAYDRRGHGRSEDPGQGFDYDTLADDLADVLAALDLSAVTLVAMSGAAGEAVRYLTRHGTGRIARLALVGPTTPLLAQRLDNPAGIPAEVLAALREELRRDFPLWLARNVRAFGGPDASDATLEWVCRLASQASLPGLLDFHRNLAETDFRAELAALRLPVLVIQGEADATCPIELTGRPTAALVPGARLVEIPGAPHGLIVSHPERLSAALLDFVSPAAG